MAFIPVTLVGLALQLSALLVQVSARNPGVDCGSECPLGGKSKKYLPQPKGIATLYHATNEVAAGKILKDGFRPGKKGVAGAGIYFGESKLGSWFKSQKGCRKIFEATVKVGCMLELQDPPEGNEWEKRDAKTNKAALDSMNCDSIRIIWTDGSKKAKVDDTELVLYDKSTISEYELCSVCSCM